MSTPITRAMSSAKHGMIAPLMTERIDATVTYGQLGFSSENARLTTFHVFLSISFFCSRSSSIVMPANTPSFLRSLSFSLSTGVGDRDTSGCGVSEAGLGEREETSSDDEAEPPSFFLSFFVVVVVVVVELLGTRCLSRLAVLTMAAWRSTRER